MPIVEAELEDDPEKEQNKRVSFSAFFYSCRMLMLHLFLFSLQFRSDAGAETTTGHLSLQNGLPSSSQTSESSESDDDSDNDTETRQNQEVGGPKFFSFFLFYLFRWLYLLLVDRLAN